MNSVVERFESKYEVMMDDRGCWEWTGARQKNGYGQFTLRHNEKRLAHRMSHELYLGVIPEGKLVCHDCDNKSCVNPSHLFLDDQFGNMKDMIGKGRGRWAKGETHCCARFTLEQVLDIRSGTKTNKELSELHNADSSTISGIKKRRWWKHV